MGDVGELVIVLFTLGAVAYYKLPWLRSWARSWFTVRVPETARPVKMVDTAPTVPSARSAESRADERTDGRTDGVPALSKVETLLQLDKTRRGVVKALVLAGWSVEEIRGVVKGANGDIGKEIEQARKELDQPGPSRPELVGERAMRIRREETTPAA